MTEKIIIYYYNVNGFKISVSFKGDNNNMFGIDWWTLKLLVNDYTYEHRLLSTLRVSKICELLETMGFEKVFEQEKISKYVQ